MTVRSPPGTSSGPGPGFHSALIGGGLWSAMELLRLGRLGLLGFSGPLRLGLFVAAHLGLCVAAALSLCAVACAPLLLTRRRGPLALWLFALCTALVGLGYRLSFRVQGSSVALVVSVAALILAPLCLVLAGDLQGLRAGRRPPRAAVRAALCALGAAAACALNQRYLPQQLFHFHGAVTAFGIGLGTLSAAYLLQRPRGARPVVLIFIALAALGLADMEVRHALFVLGQESRAVIYALRKLGRSQGRLTEWQGAGPGAERAAADCGPVLFRRVLFITIDSLRADHLRAYGYPRETAPRFSALAARSVLFEHAFSGAPSTSPAMRRIFAVTDAGGRKVSRLGQALEKGGVRAEAVLTTRMTDYFGEGVNRIFAALHGVPIEGDVIDRVLAPEAERLLLLQDAGLLWVHLASPHLPYLRWPEGPDFGPGPLDRYDGEIAEADRALSRLLDAARMPPLGAQTAIVITADHGEELGDHGGEAHGRLGMFNEEIRVPLVIAAPGALPRRVRENVSHDDLAPTLAALLGACDPRLVGRSLVPALAGRPLSPVPILIGPRTPFLGGALIDGRYKLAFVLFNRSVALYDMAADPGERQNLIGRRPELGGQMTTLLRKQLSALAPGFRPQDQ